jgi:hypothetical protein
VSAGKPIGRVAIVRRAKPVGGPLPPPGPERVELTLAPEVVALLNLMAESEGVPREFVVAVALRGLYASRTWR